MDTQKIIFITQVIEKPLNSLGYDLINLSLSGKKRMKLQVMIDRLDGNPLTMDDCVKASRHVSSILDVEDPIESSYDLEVSSPGLDRPLRVPKDFTQYIKEKIKIRTFEFVDNQRLFQGILESVSENGIVLMLDASGVLMNIDFHHIQRANLVPNFENLKKGNNVKRKS